MAESEIPLSERKARKSVSFTEKQVVVETDGSVIMADAIIDDNKTTAESHAAPPVEAPVDSLAATPETPDDAIIDDNKTTAESHAAPPVEAPVDSPAATPETPADAIIDDNKTTAESHAAPPVEAPVDSPAATPETPADDGLDLSLLKKKKKKKVKIEGDDENADGAAPADVDDAGLDLTLKKKKKKKAVKDEDDEFAAKLKALDIDKEEGAGAAGEEGAAGAADAALAVEDAGDPDEGTGIWAHDDERPLTYDLLLTRFFHELAKKKPDYAQTTPKHFRIPPPQVARDGNKKTAFANLPEICKRMKRSDEHVISYLFAELGTSGSVDGGHRLIIKGRFQQKQIENVLRKYIVEYVACKTCKSLLTELNKGENRLFFITCHACGSRRSVAAIKTGFHAQIGKRKKM